MGVEVPALPALTLTWSAPAVVSATMSPESVSASRATLTSRAPPRPPSSKGPVRGHQSICGRPRERTCGRPPFRRVEGRPLRITDLAFVAALFFLTIFFLSVLMLHRVHSLVPQLTT